MFRCRLILSWRRCGDDATATSQRFRNATCLRHRRSTSRQHREVQQLRVTEISPRLLQKSRRHRCDIKFLLDMIRQSYSPQHVFDYVLYKGHDQKMLGGGVISLPVPNRVKISQAIIYSNISLLRKNRTTQLFFSIATKGKFI